MPNYVDSCLTLEILKQDSGLLPKPRENWNTFVPKQGDIAHVDENDTDYVFDGEQWVEDGEEIAEPILEDSIEEVEETQDGQENN